MNISSIIESLNDITEDAPAWKTSQPKFSDEVRFIMDKSDDDTDFNNYFPFNPIEVTCSRKKLSAASPYFQAMFEAKNFTESAQTEIKLQVPPYSSASAVARLVRYYMETQELVPRYRTGLDEPLNKSNVVCVYAAADYYGMEAVVAKCIVFISKYGVTVARFLRLIQFHVKHPRTDAHDIITRMIGSMFPALTKCPGFCELDAEELRFCAAAAVPDCDLRNGHFRSVSYLDRTQSRYRYTSSADATPRNSMVVANNSATTMVSRYDPRTTSDEEHATIYEYDLRLHTERSESWPYDINHVLPSASSTQSITCNFITGLTGTYAVVYCDKDVTCPVALLQLERRTGAGPFFRFSRVLDCEWKCCAGDAATLSLQEYEFEFDAFGGQTQVVMHNRHYGLYTINTDYFEVHDVGTRNDRRRLPLPPFGFVDRRHGCIRASLETCSGYIFLYTGHHFAKFDTATKKWEEYAPPQPSRWGCSMIELDGFLYMIGGYNIVSPFVSQSMRG
ncbi:uncharacterized protein LOC129597241 isoform X2 [Paramacrobiotus metropolitanus]|uniref:uncharacterized protein LOC129597241 isoform X2 n=1 Tax=Paramacrobiotus metropolitanus TaxID=2943436 RepID=UPI00244653CA|nr:uncharacterized protein LOC129597241 isoform X2 [Paramacrobiotus metropolitanus]